MTNLRPLPRQRSHFARCCAIALVLVTLVGLCSLPAAFAEDVGTLTAKVVLRKSADADSKALQTLPEGDEVSVLGVSGSWYKINYGKFTGYVMKKYVKVASNTVAANASKIAELGDAPGALHVGDEGDDVKKLQKALKILGLYDLTVDGKYGEGTKVAVACYQQTKELEADGVAGKATITSLFGSCAKTADITVSGEATAADDSSATTTASTSSSTTCGFRASNRRMASSPSLASPASEKPSALAITLRSTVRMPSSSSAIST